MGGAVIKFGAVVGGGTKSVCYLKCCCANGVVNGARNS